MELAIGVLATLELGLIAFFAILSVVCRPRCPVCHRQSLVLLERPFSRFMLVDGDATYQCKACGTKSVCDMIGRWQSVDRG